MDTATPPPPQSLLQRWRAIAQSTFAAFFLDRDNAPRCAAVAFFGFLSFFPAIATVALIYGIVANRQMVADTISGVGDVVPQLAQGIIAEQLTMLASQPPATLGLGLLITIPFALWSGSRGVDSLLYAMTRIRNESPRRGFFTSLAYAIGLSIAGAIFVVLALLAVAGLPALIPWPSGEEVIALALRWPILLLLSVLVLAALYRWGPDRHPRKFRYIWPGAILASLLWLLAGAIFSIYVENWGHYEATFGSVSAAVVLLLWLYNSAQILVLGAAFNTEIERSAHQRARSSRS
ncbi:YihY/virulence factor BrkB family protein [Devosia sp. A16]|uniref:YihY/virulence factor BrkB family protein n=1 Tax=Devosia sp. A16 TaxID=1736675 RepID=UPI0006D820C2|nr:YihY/virulence factor BrkB family protein [Devosia sp. A16]